MMIILNYLPYTLYQTTKSLKPSENQREWWDQLQNVIFHIIQLKKSGAISHKNAIHKQTTLARKGGQVLGSQCYTGCLNTICQTSNQHFFRTKLHSKQKPFIFGILSRGDLCLIHKFIFLFLYTASTASDIQGVIIQVI